MKYRPVKGGTNTKKWVHYQTNFIQFYSNLNAVRTKDGAETGIISQAATLKLDSRSWVEESVHSVIQPPVTEAGEAVLPLFLLRMELQLS